MRLRVSLRRLRVLTEAVLDAERDHNFAYLTTERGAPQVELIDPELKLLVEVRQLDDKKEAPHEPPSVPTEATPPKT